MSAQPVALREINVDTLVRPFKRDRLVTLRREKKCRFSENLTGSAGLEPGTHA